MQNRLLTADEKRSVTALYNHLKRKAKALTWTEKIILKRALDSDMAFDDLPPAGKEMFIALYDAGKVGGR